MAQSPQSSESRAALRAHISYLRDLGLFDLYRREPVQSASVETTSRSDPAPASAELLRETGPDAAMLGFPRIESALGLDAPTAHERPADDEEMAIAARKPTFAPIAFTPGAPVAPGLRAQVLSVLRDEIGPCTRCPLGFAGRQTIVFGDGDPNARLLFVGEGPGADEDAQGVPFVGRAGQLLNNMITAMGLKREQVYIANIVKCRPPQNRTPEPVEAHTCSQFLFRQIDIIRPQVIVALGSTAATYLLGGKSSLSALRGRLHTTHAHPDAKLIVTYHPAYLLRDPRQKKEAWADLQIAMATLRDKG